MIREQVEEDDPFDTSGVIIPESSIKETPNATITQPESITDGVAVKGPTPMLAQLATLITPPQQKMEAVNEENDFSEFTNHRRGMNASFNNDPDANLPQLTSPLSPPAFNPHEINLEPNEAIAGLESPMPVSMKPEASKSNDVFNWLDNKMSDLKIGKKSLNSIALEKKQNELSTTPSIPVSRNATVFQFPDLAASMPSQTQSVSKHNEAVIQQPSLVNEKPKTNGVEPLYATVNKTKQETNDHKPIVNHHTSHQNSIPTQMMPQNLQQQSLPNPPNGSQILAASQVMMQRHQQPPGHFILPQQQNTTTQHQQQIMQQQQQQQPYAMMMWPVRPVQPPNWHQNQQPQMMIQNGPRQHHPNCNSVRGLRPPQASPSNIMTQSYPGPNILQPQKIDPKAANASKTEPTLDKEFLAELEKNLGLTEATANLMPPSPASSTVQVPTKTNVAPNAVPSSANNVPTLLPPPQASNRQSSRSRSQSNIVLKKKSSSVQPPQPPTSTRRDDSLTRSRPLESGPLRVALPEDPQPSSNRSNSRTATVKPFQSPNSKGHNIGGMGDVAAARGNWRPLALGSSANQPRDFLAEQRRQMAEIERLRSASEVSGNSYQATRNSRSQSVLPPSGASRPTNHLEVNKMAQVKE